MNLKFKLSHKITATATIINDTQAIFTDECTASVLSTSHIITADNLKELWSQIYFNTIATTKLTTHKPILALIHNNKCIIHNFSTRSKVEIASEQAPGSTEAPESPPEMFVVLVYYTPHNIHSFQSYSKFYSFNIFYFIFY